MKKAEKHTSYRINLRGCSVHGDDKIGYITSVKPADSTKVVSDLAKAIWRLWNDGKNCPNCGGIVPEMHIRWKDREYSFTCFQIVSLKSGKTLLRTDYKRMSGHLSLSFKCLNCFERYAVVSA